MTTPSSSTCPHCQTPLAADAAQGLCPKCLFAQAVLTEAEQPTQPATAMPAIEDIAAAFPELDVLELIGRGGMGVVYKARQKSLNRLVALKLLAPERVDDPKFATRFEKEAHALAALNHPNIVGVYDFGKFTPKSDSLLPGYFLLMEFVDGVNLRQAMKAGRFTPEQALAIVPPVCEALQYAHEHGIVHRDIKPENLLLDKEGRVKIADFGIAKMLDAEASESVSQPVGTPRYMAPEQSHSDAHVDHRADIYSLGVVLYELLTGELPTAQMQPPSRRVQIDVRLDEIVLRALNEKPELRWQTASEFQTQVQTIVQQPALRDDPQQRLYHAMGYHTTWGQRLLKLSFVGLLGFLGFVPGLEFMQVCSVFLVFMAIGGIVEKVHQARQVNHVLPKRTWWHKALTAIVLATIIVIPLRAWVIQAFVINGKSLEPEMPPGSHLLVWKLANHYATGDIVAHKHGDQVWVSRVVRVEDGVLIVQRNQWPEEKLPKKDVIGKVVSVYWRASPAPRTVVLKAYRPDAPTISKGLKLDSGGWLIENADPQGTRLFEFRMPALDDCTVCYRAKVRTEKLEGKCSLQMLCHTGSRGKLTARELDDALSGTSDWTSLETSIFLRRDDHVDLLELNLSVQGKGRVWIKDVELRANFRGIKPSQPPRMTTSTPTPKLALEIPSRYRKGAIRTEPEILFLRWETKPGQYGPACRADGTRLTEDEMRSLQPLASVRSREKVRLPALQVAMIGETTLIYAETSGLYSTLVFDDGEASNPSVATERNILTREVSYRDDKDVRKMPGYVHCVSFDILKKLKSKVVDIDLHYFAGSYHYYGAFKPADFKAPMKLDGYTDLLEVVVSPAGNSQVRLACRAERQIQMGARKNGKLWALHDWNPPFRTTPGELTFQIDSSLLDYDEIVPGYWDSHIFHFQKVHLPPPADAKQ